MKVSVRIAIGFVVTLVFAIVFRVLVGDSVVTLFAPGGSIATQERDVIIRTVLVMLAGAVPTLILLYAFAWHYREGNPKAKYEPELKSDAWRELALWALPAMLVMVLWGIVWKSTQALDPFNAIDSSKPPITIQVVALRWKWLFIYPKQDVATVNHVMLPAHTPVHFELTADGPVSAFWIPQLGSQIYAMGAMMTQLNIIADRPGEYPGRNVEINGDGYSDMTFTAKVVSDEDFDRWVSETKQDREVLDAASYDALVEPSTNNAQASYAAVEPGLFDTIMKKYMQPMPSGSPEQPEPEMDMYGM